MGGGCLGWSALVFMSSGMFRGKESSNRIELSRLVQDLLNFGVSGSLQLWGWGVVEGYPPQMCTCMHTDTHTLMHGKHDNFMQMAAPLGESLGIPYDVICMCMCMHMCVHVCGGTLSPPPPTSTHPPTPQRGPPESVKIQ